MKNTVNLSNKTYGAIRNIISSICLVEKYVRKLF